jgi:hypothetical protein
MPYEQRSIRIITFSSQPRGRAGSDTGLSQPRPPI